MVNTAVILAAGQGTRLATLGRSHPKGFLQFGNKPIIAESIEKLLSLGIQEIIIVTGYLCHFYEQLAKQYPQITTCYNSQYATSGSLYSLYCAKDLIQQDFFLLESDLIYEERALTILKNFPKDNAILLSGTTNAGDEVYVETQAQTIVNMSKKPEKLNQITGELVGISKISLLLFQLLLQEAAARFAATLNIDYETDGLVAVAQNYPIYYQLVPDLIWAEIDDYQHLMRAKQKVYPALRVNS
ncbi:MAG: phosphocholine cytidylyltransferase family protein [Jaaginema sp. PMC 1079.18]|nr:phosphocholine cytidylyltransferase family protein [Jaaginema sp. PMC 1079.18]